MSSDSTPTRVVLSAFESGDRVICEYCGRTVFREEPPVTRRAATADHRVPKCRGGRNGRSNIAIACLYCNQRKGPLTAVEFRKVMHDSALLAAARQAVLVALDPDRAKYGGSKKKRKQAKRERRQAQLIANDRIRAADPDCPECHGSGQTNRSFGVWAYCVCRIVEPRGRTSQPH